MGLSNSASSKDRWYSQRVAPILVFFISFALLLGSVFAWRSISHDELFELSQKSQSLVVALITLVSALVSVLVSQLVRLQQSRENLRLTIESSTDIVVLFDSQARYIEVFSASRSKLVAAPELIVGKTVREVMGVELGARVEKAIAEVVLTGEKQSLGYSLVLGGEEVWFESVLSKRDSDTVVAMIRDTTPEKRLSQQLDEQQRFIENILDAISDPIFIKNEQHEWLYGNKAFSSVLGRTRSEYYGKTDFDIFPEEIAKKFFESDDQMFKRMQEYETEEIIFQDGSEPRTILTKKIPYTDNSGKRTLIGIIRDITDRKVMETQLEEERARQVGASRLASLGEMAGGVAHEINNPLAIIAGYTGRLSDVITAEPFARDRALEIVSRIERTTARIATIVKGLRAISREGGFDPKDTTSVEAIVQDTLGLCFEKFRNHGVTVDTKFEPGLVVSCRSVQISQVLLNLLTNAFFAVSKQPNAKIYVDTKLIDNFVEISVVDSGLGIEPALRERIFEPFFTTKPVGMGTGLGLSIAASIVREHQGELLLDPASSRTRFVIRLPATVPTVIEG